MGRQQPTEAEVERVMREIGVDRLVALRHLQALAALRQRPTFIDPRFDSRPWSQR